MVFEWLIIILGWTSVAIFFVAVAYKIVKIASMPLTLRWEVYPIPHEEKDRRQYGGSYMEQVDWARQRKPRSFLAEVVEFLLPEAVEIGTEILTMKKVREHNRYGLWAFSTAMHWGIYAYILWVVLLIGENLFHLAAFSALTTVVGVGACALGIVGTVGLIVRRATSPQLALYTAPVDYINLAFMALIFVLTGASWLSAGSVVAHRAFVGSILFFKPASAPALVVASFLLFELFVAYMPFSKLLHYVIKYFVYHHGLWDDAFKVKGSAADHKIVEQLGYTVTWSGPHIVQGKTWLEEAQASAVEGEKK